MKKYINSSSITLLLFILSVSSTLLSVLVYRYESDLIQYVWKRSLVLDPDTFVYETWSENPVPLHLDMYMFNWTNPDALGTGEKLKFVEIGPFRFREYRTKVDVVFNDNNDTVTYRQNQRWFFIRNESVADLDTKITNINPILLSAAYSIRHSNLFLKSGFNVVARQLGDLYITKTVGEILFDGYDDIFLTMGKQLSFVAGSIPDWDKFAWFYKRNGTSDFQGTFNMDLRSENMGQLLNWNYENQTNYYEDECGEIRGSAGEFFPTNLFHADRLELFCPDICRPIALDFVHIETVKGVAGRKYETGDSFLDNGNKCFCTGDCLPSGALNISTCRLGSPGFVSLPHFYKGDKFYFEHIDGLSPSRDKHNFFITLEPTTGMFLSLAVRMQINLFAEPQKYLSVLNDVPRMLIPALWFEQVVTLPDNYIIMLQFLLYTPKIICTVLLVSAVCYGWLWFKRASTINTTKSTKNRVPVELISTDVDLLSKDEFVT